MTVYALSFGLLMAGWVAGGGRKAWMLFIFLAAVTVFWLIDYFWFPLPFMGPAVGLTSMFLAVILYLEGRKGQ